MNHKNNFTVRYLWIRTRVKLKRYIHAPETFDTCLNKILDSVTRDTLNTCPKNLCKLWNASKWNRLRTHFIACHVYTWPRVTRCFVHCDRCPYRHISEQILLRTKRVKLETCHKRCLRFDMCQVGHLPGLFYSITEGYLNTIRGIFVTIQHV